MLEHHKRHQLWTSKHLFTCSSSICAQQLKIDRVTAFTVTHMSQRPRFDLHPASFDFTFNLLHQHQLRLPSPSSSVDTAHHQPDHSLLLPTLPMCLQQKRCRRSSHQSAETLTSTGQSQGPSFSITHPFSMILTSLRPPPPHYLPSLHQHSPLTAHLNGQAARRQPPRSAELRQDQASAFYIPPSSSPTTLFSPVLSQVDRQRRCLFRSSARYHKPGEASAPATSSLLRSQQPQCRPAVPDRSRH